MKSITILLGVGLVSLLAGCSTTPVALVAVGPNPAGIARLADNGSLQVFSSLDEQDENPNQASDDPAPVWYQHTSYNLYDMAGKRLKYVDNTIGKFDQAPRNVILPAGRYIVEAQTMNYTWVDVPVIIERGRTTKIHLDGHWAPPMGAPRQELVSLPNGIPVGWPAESTASVSPHY